MGRIVPVVLHKSNYPLDECIREYWYQNVIDDPEEYEKYKINQKKIRDHELHQYTDKVHLKMDTAILTPSINGGVSIIVETD